MRWGILAFLFFLAVINFADKSIAGLAAVPIMKDLNLTYSQWGVVGSSFFWFFSIAGVIGAALSDRIGTKKMLAIMALIWSVVQFSAFIITGLPLLLLSRVLLGIGEGPFYATAVNHLNKWFPPESRSLPLSILNFGNSIGALVSAPILVALIVSSGWRIAYGILGCISLVWFILWMWLGRDKPENKAMASDTKEPLEKIKWSELVVILRSRTFIFTSLAGFAAYWMVAFILVWMPTYLTEVKSFTQTNMGYFIAAAGVIASVLYITLSWLTDHLFRKNQSYRKSHVFVSGLSLILAGLLFYSITLLSHSAWIFAVMCFVQASAILMFIMGPQIVTYLLPERGGLMSGLMMGIATLAGIVGSAVVGNFVQSAGNHAVQGFNHAIVLSSALLFIFGICFLLLANPERSVGVNSSSIKTAQVNGRIVN
ncbi:MFS transporter [Rossellomorea aquimaris]|uniref:MFS transporter n=1 Tax=Rossellomorea aquimaris TaxID=189382 RepID=UPI0024958FF6|nr:MFS transporter [Rossellomorea aquimaris]